VCHINEFTTFQQNKDEHSHPTRLLQPLPILERKWEIISMDFITGLPRAQGKDCIFLVVNRLTKFSHFFPSPWTTTHHKWLNYSSERSFGYMAYLRPL
jgi:hypothetical protein